MAAWEDEGGHLGDDLRDHFRPVQGAPLVTRTPLTALAREQLHVATRNSARSSAGTVDGGEEQVLHQAVIALRAGHLLAEHESLGEATICPLRERAVPACAGTRRSGPRGGLVTVPGAECSPAAVESPVVQISEAEVADCGGRLRGAEVARRTSAAAEGCAVSAPAGSAAANGLPLLQGVLRFDGREPPSPRPRAHGAGEDHLVRSAGDEVPFVLDGSGIRVGRPSGRPKPVADAAGQVPETVTAPGGPSRKTPGRSGEDGAQAAPLQLASAVLFVQDLRDSVAFYRELLGWEVTVYDEAVALLSGPGKTQLYLRMRDLRSGHPLGQIGWQYLIWTAQDAVELDRCEAVLRGVSSQVTRTRHVGFSSVEGRGPSDVPVIVTFPGPDAAQRAGLLGRVYAW